MRPRDSLRIPQKGKELQLLSLEEETDDKELSTTPDKALGIEAKAQVNVVGKKGPAPASKRSNKKVTFGSAHVYEHAVIPGDNPACLVGVPLTIDWKCIASYVESLDTEPKKGDPKTVTSESSIAEDSLSRRSYSEMIIPPNQRFQFLLKQGYTRRELTALTRPVNIQRAQRRRTLETLSLQPIEASFERVKRSLRKIVRNPRQRAEIKVLEEWARGHHKLLRHFSNTNRSCIKASSDTIHTSSTAVNSNSSSTIVMTKSVKKQLRTNDPLKSDLDLSSTSTAFSSSTFNEVAVQQ